MSRIGATFARLKERGEKALVVYATAGDPDLARSRELVLEVARRGADVIELGVPFSDPNADGPAIQAAMARARAAGVTLSRVMELCAELRAQIETPIVIFGYYNPIFVRGCERFAKEAAGAGADGVLVVDLPPEEAEELAAPLRAVGLDYVPLLAPTSTETRVAAAAARASGFLYYVSLAGVTGAAIPDVQSVAARVQSLRGRVPVPIAVGFGVSTPDEAKRIGACADGVVVGSAIVRAAECGGATAAGDLVESLKRAL